MKDEIIPLNQTKDKPNILKDLVEPPPPAKIWQDFNTTSFTLPSNNSKIRIEIYKNILEECKNIHPEYILERIEEMLDIEINGI